jgi:hypothetical protein
VGCSGLSILRSWKPPSRRSREAKELKRAGKLGEAGHAGKPQDHGPYQGPSGGLEGAQARVIERDRKRHKHKSKKK